MKKTLIGAALLGAFFLATGCSSDIASGIVTNKRAPGYPGEKVYQVEVDRDMPVGPAKIWVTVTVEEWDRCGLLSEWPVCAVDEASPPA